jgi:hypothetical protein
MIQIKADFHGYFYAGSLIGTGGYVMSEGESLYLGLVIGAFVLFGLVMGFVNLRQK